MKYNTERLTETTVTPWLAKSALVRRILSRGGPVFTRCAYYAGRVRIETAKAIVTGAGLEHIGADCAIGLHRTGCVLELIADALGKLHRRARTLAERFELPWITAVLRQSVIGERSANFAQGLGRARFRLSGGIALPLRHDKPQKTPDRAEEDTQQHSPSNQDFAKPGPRRRSIRAGNRRGKVSAAMRTNFGGLIDFGFAFAASVHGRKIENVSRDKLHGLVAGCVAWHRNQTPTLESIRIALLRVLEIQLDAGCSTYLNDESYNSNVHVRKEFVGQGGIPMISSIIRNFMKQQGFTEEPDSVCDMHFSGLYFQPRIMGLLVVIAIFLQSPILFMVLSAALWWNVAFPKWNPFELFYNRVLALPRGKPTLSSAPPPRVFAQAMAAAFMLLAGLALLAGWMIAAWILEAFLVIAFAALLFGKFCLGAYVYHLLRGQIAFANSTLPWVHPRA